jgi:hypothetical protein
LMKFENSRRGKIDVYAHGIQRDCICVHFFRAAAC